MKVGILTFHWANNYGALLQAYGLCETIKKLGHEVEIINLQPKKIKRDWRYYVFGKPYNTFRRKHLPIQNLVYYSSEELKDAEFDYDLYIVGSDQVWNKEITRELMYSYYFDFLSDNVKNISFSASFGLANWIYNKDETNKIKKLINKFTAISIREKSGVDLCLKHLQVEAANVLDPTLLLGDFSKFIKSDLKDSKEIVCFKFIQDEQFYHFGLKLAKIENKKIRLLNNLKPVKGFKWSPLLGIPKLITKIKHSSLVVTDSFHITCLAIIFRKQMIVLRANPKRIGRITDLFKALNLNEHFYHSYDEVLEKKNWKKEIDYEQVTSRLNTLQDKSLMFLKSNLK